MMMAGTASGYYYCAEYVMDYHGHAANLYLSGLDAQGFYDEMYWLPNWNPKFPLMGNDSAWEKHWKDPSVMGGIDSEWVDSAHFAYFSGHGSEVGLEFGTMNDDYTCQYLDAKWGNTQLDWVALDACKILNETTFGYWMGSPPFSGLHSILGFDTEGCGSADRGKIFVWNMVGSHGYSKKTIKEVWFYAADLTIPFEDQYSVAILAADVDGDMRTLECLDDYLYGYGSQCQPPALTRYFQYENRLI